MGLNIYDSEKVKEQYSRTEGLSTRISIHEKYSTNTMGISNWNFTIYEIKEGMKDNDLKSKDMKRFIEYGWLSAIPDVKLGRIPDFKFNFRDGVERCANLRQYSKVYEMSSEIAHSSPLLIYSSSCKKTTSIFTSVSTSSFISIGA